MALTSARSRRGSDVERDAEHGHDSTYRRGDDDFDVFTDHENERIPLRPNASTRAQMQAQVW
jgi:hypothetical protein